MTVVAGASTRAPGLGDGSQSEGQDPVFRVENGATLRNVVIGNNGADGIHTYNGAVLDNIYWMNVGEDAMTIKSSGTTTVSNIEGYDADDKFFQVNAASTLNVTNCIIHRAGKALRQNGGTHVPGQRQLQSLRHQHHGRGRVPHRQLQQHGRA